MAPDRLPLPAFLAEPSRLGTEISVTGKWVPSTPGGWFRRSEDSGRMRQEWENIHADAAADEGVLSTEINHAVGEDAVLVHHVFADADALIHYFSTTATQHMGALKAVATPELHLVRGVEVPAEARTAIQAKAVPIAIGEHLYGYVKEDYRRPDLAKAIMVTAKWTCTPGDESHLDELEHWWQRVGTDAHSLEEGLLRFEAYRVAGEDALIIHETFRNTAELRFHLSKGTAARYKKDIDRIASPDAYFFRGPVSWDIRTYSKFLHLPATYSSLGSQFTRPGGSMSEGTTVVR
ncbi:MAG: quinol monooxygenase YgiN [Myxococcota bacterium]|jgi:quinol monooxygenase YgiN